LSCPASVRVPAPPAPPHTSPQRHSPPQGAELLPVHPLMVPPLPVPMPPACGRRPQRHEANPRPRLPRPHLRRDRQRDAVGRGVVHRGGRRRGTCQACHACHPGGERAPLLYTRTHALTPVSGPACPILPAAQVLVKPLDLKRFHDIMAASSSSAAPTDDFAFTRRNSTDF